MGMPTIRNINIRIGTIAGTIDIVSNLVPVDWGLSGDIRSNMRRLFIDIAATPLFWSLRGGDWGGMGR